MKLYTIRVIMNRGSGYKPQVIHLDQYDDVIKWIAEYKLTPAIRHTRRIEIIFN